MTRRRYLITYDISDDKRRYNVFRTLIGQADHVQYSVFLGELSRMELAALRAELQQIIHTKDDQVVLVDLGVADNNLEAVFECLGKRYNPQTRVQIV